MIRIIDKDGFRKFIVKAERSMVDDIEDEMHDILNDFKNNVARAMQQTIRRTDRSYSSGRVSPQYPSAPGNPPAIDRGELVRKMFVEKMRDGSKFESSAIYAGYLEDGTHKMDARPVYEKELEAMDITDRVLDIIKRTGR